MVLHFVASCILPFYVLALFYFTKEQTVEKTRRILANGISLTTVKDNRFKNDFLSVSFLFPLKGRENALSYLLPSVMVRGCKKYDSVQKLDACLEEAYDGEIGTDVYRAGDTRVIRFSGAWLRGELTFDKTNPEDTVLDKRTDYSSMLSLFEGIEKNFEGKAFIPVIDMSEYSRKYMRTVKKNCLNFIIIDETGEY